MSESQLQHSQSLKKVTPQEQKVTPQEQKVTTQEQKVTTQEQKVTPQEQIANLSPSWIQWMSDALSRGVKRQEIIRALTDQGHPEPNALLSALIKHPLFIWGNAQSTSLYRRDVYQELQAQLWEQLPSPKVPRVSGLSRERFERDFYCTSRPVIIEEWATQWDALGADGWSPQAFLERFKGVEVEVTEGREACDLFDVKAAQLRVSTTMDQLAQRVIHAQKSTNDFYMIARNYAFRSTRLRALLDEIDERPYLNPEAREGCVALWFGPQGTLTPLHHDTCHILFVQIWGRKKVTLIPPYEQSLFKTSINMYSDRDPETATLSKGQVSVDLNPGDALLIPTGWWHHVRALSSSISLAMTHFHQKNRFNGYQPGLFK